MGLKILVCPLDWGLGHATRCIPLIRALRSLGHEIEIGATGGGKRLLESEFPDLRVFNFPGYRVRYSRSAALFLPVMLIQLPAILIGMARERGSLVRLVAERKPDLVISDGRYGVRSDSVPTVFITHQVFIRIPGRFPGRAFAERVLFRLNQRLLLRFKQVWVPDYPGPENLSGVLGHQPCDIPNLFFIRPLSRFSPADPDATEKNPTRLDILAMVSGPEPQRGLFEAALRKQLQAMPGTRVLIKGVPGIGKPTRVELTAGAYHEFDHLGGEELGRLMETAKVIIARSGYTTVMELAALETRYAILVPTPGQSEQEYLAEHLDHNRTALRMDQDRLDVPEGIARLETYSGFKKIALDGKNTEFKNLGVPLLSFLKDNPLMGNYSNFRAERA